MKTEQLLSRVRTGEALSFKEQVFLITKLSVPTILAQISSIVMSFIDASMVGKLGSADSASIGLVASSTWLVAGFCFAAAMGFTVQVSHLIGANNEKAARNLVKIAFLATIFYSIVVMVLCASISGELPKFLGKIDSTDEIYENARIYFLVFCLSVPIIQLNNLAAGLLQAAGEMKIPSIMQILMAVMNVALNYMFIFALRWGVLGAAVATVIARGATTLILLLFLIFSSPILRLTNRTGEKMQFDAKYLSTAIKIGMPIAFEQAIMSGGQVAFTKIVAPLGKIALAANSFAITAESICYMPAYGLGAAATTVCGQSFGARRYDLTYRLGWLTTLIGIVLMLVMGALLFIFAPEMIGFLSPDESVRRLGTRVLRIESFSEMLYGASLVANGALRGTGDTLVPSLYKFFSMWLVRIPLALFLRTQFALEGIWFAMSFELCVRGLLFLIRLKGKSWVKPVNRP